MKKQFSEEQKFIRAKKRVTDIKEFYQHLLAYCLVIPFLIFINKMTVPSFNWFWFPMFGWGIGLFFHGWSVFGGNMLFGKEWEKRKIKEMMDKYDDNESSFKRKNYGR